MEHSKKCQFVRFIYFHCAPLVIHTLFAKIQPNIVFIAIECRVCQATSRYDMEGRAARALQKIDGANCGRVAEAPGKLLWDGLNYVNTCLSYFPLLSTQPFPTDFKEDAPLHR